VPTPGGGIGPLDEAQEPGELDGKGDREIGVDGLGTVCDGHGLQDEAGASRHIRADGCRGCQEAVPKMVHLGARDARTNRRTARAYGPNRLDDRRAPRGNLGSLDSRADDQFLGRAQQLVLCLEAQSPRVPAGGIYDRHVPIRRGETHSSVLLPHRKWRETSGWSSLKQVVCL
jgi:hypothetical protein